MGRFVSHVKTVISRVVCVFMSVESGVIKLIFGDFKPRHYFSLGEKKTI